MSGAMRRVLTAKMLAVSALALAGIVMSVVWRRRELAADGFVMIFLVSLLLPALSVTA
jgi:hypothetical protein